MAEEINEDTSIRLPKDLKEKLASFGNASDSMADVIRKVLKNNNLYRKFIDERKLGVKFESWFGKQKD